MSEPQDDTASQHILTTTSKYYYLCSLILEGGNSWADQFMSEFSGLTHLTLPHFLELENQFFSCLIQTEAPYYILSWMFRHTKHPDLNPSPKAIIQIGLWVRMRHPVPQMDLEPRPLFTTTRYRLLACLLNRKLNKEQDNCRWKNNADALTVAEERHFFDYQLEKEARFRIHLLDYGAPKFMFLYLFRGVEFDQKQLNDFIPRFKSPAVQFGLETECETLPEPEEIIRKQTNQGLIETCTESTQTDPSA